MQNRVVITIYDTFLSAAKNSKTHQKIPANWILEKQDILKNVLANIFNVFTDTSENSAHFVVLNTFIVNIIFMHFSYLQTDCTLLQLSICSLTLFVGHKTHLIFNLCRFLAIPINCKSFPFSKMIPHEIAKIHASFLPVTAESTAAHLITCSWLLNKIHHNIVSEQYHL